MSRVMNEGNRMLVARYTHMGGGVTVTKRRHRRQARCEDRKLGVAVAGSLEPDGMIPIRAGDVCTVLPPGLAHDPLDDVHQQPTDPCVYTTRGIRPTEIDGSV